MVRLGTGKMMRQAGGKYEIETRVFLYQVCAHRLHMKLPAPAEALAGRFNVVRAQIESVILHLRQRFENVRRAAADVEDAIACPGADVLLNIDLPPARRANDPGEQAVNAGLSQNV